jgi:hypothetical protein
MASTVSAKVTKVGAKKVVYVDGLVRMANINVLLLLIGFVMMTWWRKNQDRRFENERERIRFLCLFQFNINNNNNNIIIIIVIIIIIIIIITYQPIFYAHIPTQTNKCDASKTKGVFSSMDHHRSPPQQKK